MESILHGFTSSTMNLQTSKRSVFMNYPSFLHWTIDSWWGIHSERSSMHATYTHMLVLTTINQKQTSKLAVVPTVNWRIICLLGYSTHYTECASGYYKLKKFTFYSPITQFGRILSFHMSWKRLLLTGGWIGLQRLSGSINIIVRSRKTH